MFKIKDLSKLEELGFKKCKTSAYPEALIKILDDTFLLKVKTTKPSYNMWTGKDWTDNSILQLVQYENMSDDYYDTVVSFYGDDMVKDYTSLFKDNIERVNE